MENVAFLSFCRPLEPIKGWVVWRTKGISTHGEECNLDRYVPRESLLTNPITGPEW
jgi:hypothetical protein